MVEVFDTFSTIKNLYSILNVFGLSCIVRDGIRLKNSWSLFKNIFYLTLFTVINLFCLFIKLYMIRGIFAFNFRDVIEMVYLLGYFQYIIDLYLVFKHKSAYLDYILMYDRIDKMLGTNYHTTIKNTVVRICLILISACMLNAVSDYVLWCLNDGWFVTTIASMEYVYFNLKILGIVEIIANAVQLEYRLKIIGDLLEAEYNSLPPVLKDVKTMIRCDHQEVYHLEVSALNSNESDVILWITRCYLLLLDQAEQINVLFGFRILHTSAVFLLQMIITTNIVIRLMIGSLKVVYKWKNLLIISSFLRVVTGSLIVLCGINRLERCYRQPERIFRILDRTLLYRNISNPVQHALRVLRELVVTRPLHFHAYNFYRLDFTFVVAVSSAMITYTIILLQIMQ